MNGRFTVMLCVAGVTFALTGCAGAESPALPEWASSVCYFYGASGWDRDDPQDLVDVSDQIDRRLPSDDDGDLARAAEAFVAAARGDDAGAVEPAGQHLEAVCRAEGWELPEG